MSKPDRTGAEITMPTVSSITSRGLNWQAPSGSAGSVELVVRTRGVGVASIGCRRSDERLPGAVSARLGSDAATGRARFVRSWFAVQGRRDRIPDGSQQRRLRIRSEKRERSSDMNEGAPTVPRREESGGIEGATPVVGKSPWRLVRTRFVKDRVALAGLVFLAALLLLALAAPIVAGVVGLSLLRFHGQVGLAPVRWSHWSGPSSVESPCLNP